MTDSPGARAWLRRARDVLTLGDRRVLIDPSRLVVSFARFVARRAAHEEGPKAELPARDPAVVALIADGVLGIAKSYFRLQTLGVDNVPASGPALLVGNHSGGLVVTEGFFTGLAIHDKYGPNRALYALAHDFVFEDRQVREFFSRVGLLRAGHEHARAALDAGHLAIVYPGSDLDTFRPFTDRNKIVLGGRRGFIKLALRAQVPIIPVVTIGTHEQLIVLARGERLARLLRMHVWARANAFPIVLSLPWGLTTGLLPYFPLPAQVTQVFGAPMRWPELRSEAADDPDAVSRCYADVLSTMQRMLDELAKGRRFLLGKPRAGRDHVGA